MNGCCLLKTWQQLMLHLQRSSSRSFVLCWPLQVLSISADDLLFPFSERLRSTDIGGQCENPGGRGCTG